MLIKLIKEFNNTNNRITLRILILFCLIWISIGFFPQINIEGDSALLSAGSERLAYKNMKLPPDYFYMWAMQPMVGLSISWIKSILTIFSVEQIYLFLTMILSLLYIFICSYFIESIVKTKWEYCFLILLLFPETYSIAYYPNSTIFASIISLIGFQQILRKPLNITSATLLGIAPLYRMDILAIYPVVLIFFWFRMDFKKSLLYSGIYAVIVSIIVFLGHVLLLKTNPLNAYLNIGREVFEDSMDFDFLSFIKINATFYTIPAIIMLFIGVRELVKIGNYKLLIFALLPIGSLYLIYGDFSGAAPKHIQYILPFTGILCAISLRHFKSLLIDKRFTLPIIIIASVIFQGLVGIRLYPEIKPWIGKSYSVQNPSPTIFNLVTRQIPNIGLLQIVVGGGQVIPTADELMLISGNFFTPIFWHNTKRKEIKERKIFNGIIEGSTDTLFFMTTQASDWTFSQNIHNLGFQIENYDQQLSSSNFSSNYKFVKGKQIIYVTCSFVERNTESFNTAFNNFSHRPFFIYTLWDWQLYLINERKTNANPFSDRLAIIQN